MKHPLLFSFGCFFILIFVSKYKQMSRLSGYLSVFIFTLFTFSAVNGQNLSTNGRFPTKYFSIKDYGSAAQIWSVSKMKMDYTFLETVKIF